MIFVCAAVIKLNGKYLLTSRPPGKHLAGRWEFPGGKLDENETPQACLIREIKEELGVDIIPGRKIFTIEYKYPEKEVHLEFYSAIPLDVDDFSPFPHDGQQIKWELPEYLNKVDWVPADWPLAEYLMREE